jgi:hypothetical protein
MAMANADWPTDRFMIIGVKHIHGEARQFLGIAEQFTDPANLQQLVRQNVEPDLSVSYEPLELKSSGEIESEMTERILKSSISVLDSFNYDRNEQSLAHDNQTLSRDEALLIFGHITALVRFVQSVEARVANEAGTDDFDDIPF